VKESIALCAVVLDEAEGLAKIAREDPRFTPEERHDLDIHAVRLRSLYVRICGQAGQSTFRGEA
jgi:hypothetical protein